MNCILSLKAAPLLVLMSLVILSVYVPPTVFAATSLPADSTSREREYYTAGEFRYADHQQYTIDGLLPRRLTQVRPVPAIIAGAGFTGLVAGLQLYQGSVYWANSATFRIIDDKDYELWSDKAGHFMVGYLASKVSKDLMIASGFSWDVSVICGTLMGLGYQFYVEVMDGYGLDWGFSPSDMLGNTVGAALHLGQHYIPFLQNVSPKMEYYPPRWFGEQSRPRAKGPLDDYGAWTNWLSFNVHNMLPESLQDYWPPWLNLAVGYAARNVDLPNAESKVVISLDYDLEKILPAGSAEGLGPLWNWFRQYVNMFKLPAPAVEFSPARSPRYYLLYPFKLGASN